MYQDYEDGIIMDNTVLIIDEKKTGFPVTARIVQFLVIVIGSWSGISMLVQTIGIPCNTLQVSGAVLVFTAIFYALCLHPSYGLVKLFFSVLCYGLFFYSRLPIIQNGFYIVENLVLRRISVYYGAELLQFQADYSAPQADTTLLLIMILFPIVGLLSVAILRNVLVGIVGIIMFLPVSICFAMGLIPSESYLISYTVCLLYLTRSGYNFHHSTERQQKTLLHRISSRSAIWLSIISLIIFFLIKIFVSREDYDNLVQIKEMKAEIQASMNEFSIEEFMGKLNDVKIFTKKVSSTGLNGGELGKTGQVQYQNTKHLTITAPTQSINEGIYLKGYVGSIYTGDRWEEHSEEMQKEYEKLMQRIPLKIFPPVNQMSIFLDHFIVKEEGEVPEPSDRDTSWYEYSINKGTMKVEYKGANKKYLYAPYFTDYSILDNMLYEHDLYAAPAIREDNYEYQYYFNISLLNTPTFYESLLEKLKDYTEYEKLYRDYVYRVYTILPEGLINIKRDFSPNRVKTKTGSVTEKIEYVKNYLDQNTEYSLTPGKLPEGEDFVEYFVYQNKVGYCAHYASAATLMLRTLGIPARYIEGYAVGTESIYRNNGTQETTRYTDIETKSTIVTQSEVNVMDYNAHAWVEVYFDNCGWIPVEFTPGSNVDYTDTVVTDMEEFSDNIEDGNIRKSLEESSEVPTPMLEVPKPQQPMNDREGADIEEASRGSGKSDFIFLYIILGATLLFLAALLLYRMEVTRKARHSRNYNRRAIFCFGEIEKMLRACKGLPGKGALLEESEDYVKEHFSYIGEDDLETLMELVRKARFGSGSISARELKQILDYRDTLYLELIGALPMPKRIYLKFILLI